MTMVPRIGTLSIVRRIDSTATLSECLRSPIPIVCAHAMEPGCEVYYTDGSQANADRAHDYIRRAGVADRVRVSVGIAQDILKRTPGEFDIVFIDVDKHYYPECFHLALPRVRKGGL